LAVIEEAVTIRRQFAAARPTVFASEYANSLEAKALILSALGREAEVQAVQHEILAARSNG
jgi:hypothetical protein